MAISIFKVLLVVLSPTSLALLRTGSAKDLGQAQLPPARDPSLASLAQDDKRDTIVPEARRVDGVVELGKRSGQVPVSNVWVVLHRIGPDRSGPVDSVRTSTAGAYHIRYRASGDANAMYIAVATYHGIAYITSPLRLKSVSGDDARIMVYDTTSPPYPLRIAGRHLVVSKPGGDGRRRIVEVYELMNDSTLTVLGSPARPVWTVPVPAAITDFQLNPDGDVSAANVKRVGERLDVFAPISPGLRQLSFSYTLGTGAFPLTVPIVDSVGLMEVLVEEPNATINGPGLTEVAPVAQEGLSFRRLIAENLKSNSAIRLSMPTPVSDVTRRTITALISVFGLVMLIGLGYAFQRRRGPRIKEVTVVDPVERLLQEMTTIDARLQTVGGLSDAQRAQMTARRAELKAKVASAIAQR